MTTAPEPEHLRLPRPEGRAPRVANLVYRDAHSDSRVLKTTATLAAAGADVVIYGSARDRAGFPAGLTTTQDGLRIYRAPDLVLARMFSRTARVWRRLRGRDPHQGGLGHGSSTSAAVVSPPAPPASGAAPARTSVGDPAVPTTGTTTAVATTTATDLLRDPRALAAEVWMRTYQVGRLTYYWYGTVRAALPTRPDVVHANDGNTLVPALVLRALVGSDIVYDAHELWTHRNVRQDRWLAPRVEQVIERVVARRAAGVITVSPSIAAWMRSELRLTQEPVLVRNIPVFTGTPDPAAGRLRELTGLPPEARVVAYCGGITTGRGLEESVDALALLPPDVHLVLLGFGDRRYVDSLLDRAAARGVRHRVHEAGAVPGPQVPQALADADVAVVYVRAICLSYLYSLPNKLFESIHAGLPIVAADLPDTAALVRQHGVGEVFDARTPAELAGAITSVLADPTAYREAARTAAPTLDWRLEAGRLVELYARVLHLRHRGGTAYPQDPGPSRRGSA